jgi:hypothetical protein
VDASGAAPRRARLGLKACSEDTPHGAMRVSIVVAMAAPPARAGRPRPLDRACRSNTPANGGAMGDELAEKQDDVARHDVSPPV